jgi:chromosome segregation ATPase
MKKYSIYLREDQLDFLRTLNNASAFVREAIDQFLTKSDRTQAEKTIVMYEAIQELETKITNQEQVIEDAERQAEQIEEEIKEVEELVKVAKDVADGKFEVQEDTEGYKVVIQIGNKLSTVTKDNDSEEEARKKAIEKGKIGVKNTTSHLKEVEQKKTRHNLYLKAQQAKLQDMQENLKTLYTSMKE